MKKRIIAVASLLILPTCLFLSGCAYNANLPKLKNYEVEQEGNVLTINQPGDYLFNAGARIRALLPAGWSFFRMQKEKSKCVDCAPYGREDAYPLFISNAKKLDLKQERLWSRDWEGKKEAFIYLNYKRCTPPYTANFYSANISSYGQAALLSETVKISGFDGLMNTYAASHANEKRKTMRLRRIAALLQFQDRVLEFIMITPLAEFEENYSIFKDFLEGVQLIDFPLKKYRPYNREMESFVAACVKEKCFGDALNKNYTSAQFRALGDYWYPSYKKHNQEAAFFYFKALETASPGEQEAILSFLCSAYEKVHNRDFLLNQMELFISQRRMSDPNVYEKLMAQYEILQKAP